MRVARVYVPGAVHHIISRFVDRRFFLEIDGARSRYLSLLARSLARSDWRLLSYALMSSHTHLEAVAGEQEPEFWLKPVHSPFGLWLNRQVDGLGSVLAQRPSISIVPDEAAAEVLAYIHNNPVSAHVVDAAAASSWTSHRAYTGQDKAPPWLHVAEGLERCGFADKRDRFDEWVRSQVGAVDPSLEAERLVGRARPMAHARGAEVGTPVLGTNPTVTLVGRPGAKLRPSAQALIHLVKQVTGLNIDISSRNRAALEARLVVLAVGASTGVRSSELCAALGISKQRGSALMKEDRPIDSDAVDLVIRLLERGRGVDRVDQRDSVPIQVGGKIAGGKLRG